MQMSDKEPPAVAQSQQNPIHEEYKDPLQS